MKRILTLVIAILIGSLCMNAQLYFSCTHRDYYSWNEYTESYDPISSYDENSLFELNAAETMFTHSTPTMTSSYYVREKEYDEENDVYMYNVVSDVGNHYLYYFSLARKEIRCLIEDDGSYTLLIFTVKAMWTDD